MEGHKVEIMKCNQEYKKCSLAIVERSFVWIHWIHCPSVLSLWGLCYVQIQPWNSWGVLKGCVLSTELLTVVFLGWFCGYQLLWNWTLAQGWGGLWYDVWQLHSFRFHFPGLLCGPLPCPPKSYVSDVNKGQFFPRIGRFGRLFEKLHS